MRSLHVCMAGTWDPDFPRNRMIRKCLELGDGNVTICQVDLWGERGGAVVRHRKLAVLLRGLIAYPLLAWKFIQTPRPDIVLIPYPGHFDAPLLGLLCRLRRIPVALDTFISLFDTIVSDRKLVAAYSPIGIIARMADRIACRVPAMCLTDTPAHARYFSEDSDVPLDRFRVLWLGADEDIFQPQPDVQVVSNRVLFYGTFVRLQGVDTIVRAAKLLEPEGIEFRILGDGQERPSIDRLIAKLDATNVELPGFVPQEALPTEIASAAVCLGIFGTSAKASRVIPHKLYECLAVGRPVISGETHALRAAFAEHEVHGVPVGDAEGLAEAIRYLVSHPDVRERVARAGHSRFTKNYSEKALSQLLQGHLQKLASSGKAEHCGE